MTGANLLAEHGLALLCGATALLLLGSLLVLATRAPLHRQRFGECTLLAVAIWLIAALLPMQRWDVALSSTGDTAAGSIASRPGTAEAMPVSISKRRPDVFTGSGSAPLLEARPVPTPAAEVPSTARSSPDPAAHDAQALVGSATALPATVSADTAIGAVVTGAFLLGAVGALGYLLLGALALKRVLRTAKGAPDPVRRLARAAAADLGLTGRRVRIAVTPRVVRPFCWGLWRPTVVLPEALCVPERRASLQHVLRHEMAHVLQGDIRGQLLAALLLPALFWHPLYWWVRRRVRLAAEMVADELAARQSAADDYARGLLALLEQDAPRFAPVGALSVFGSPSEFYRRMEMLLLRRKKLTTRLSRSRRVFQLAGTVALATLAATAWGVSPAVAQQDPQPSRKVLAELRAERDALKMEIAELKLLLQFANVKRVIQDGPSVTIEEVVPETTECQVVVVERGDTLAKLLKRYCGHFGPRLVDQVRALNPELNPLKMRVGQKIVLPPGERAVEIADQAVEEPILQDIEITEPPELPRTDPFTQAATVADALMDPLRSSGAATATVMRDSTLELTMRCIDLTGEVELAEREMARIDAAHDQGVVGTDVLDRVQVNLRTAQRKLHVARALIEAEIDACKAEISMQSQHLETMTPAHPQRARTDLQIRRIVSRLKILESAL